MRVDLMREWLVDLGDVGDDEEEKHLKVRETKTIGDVFLWKFRLLIELHSICCISPTASETFQKCLTKYHDWPDATHCISWSMIWLSLFPGPLLECTFGRKQGQIFLWQCPEIWILNIIPLAGVAASGVCCVKKSVFTQQTPVFKIHTTLLTWWHVRLRPIFRWHQFGEFPWPAWAVAV